MISHEEETNLPILPEKISNHENMSPLTPQSFHENHDIIDSDEDGIYKLDSINSPQNNKNQSPLNDIEKLPTINEEKTSKDIEISSNNEIEQENEEISDEKKVLKNQKKQMSLRNFSEIRKILKENAKTAKSSSEISKTEGSISPLNKEDIIKKITILKKSVEEENISEKTKPTNIIKHKKKHKNKKKILKNHSNQLEAPENNTPLNEIFMNESK